MADTFYYLHENGDLIHKRFEPEADSPFVRRVWRLNLCDRADAWLMLIEATALGANKERVNELAVRWGCDESDALEFAKRRGLALTVDGDQLCATGPGFVDLATSPAGFGACPIEAFADLAKQTNAMGGFWGRRLGESGFMEGVE